MTCPFCQLDPADLVWQSPEVVAVRDRFPVSPGHTLVIPRRHVASWFEATAAEQAAIGRALDALRQDLDRERGPDGYNIGINVGEAAGQTVMHLHVHLIPRYRDDVDAPAGGVRHLMAGRGDYRRPGRVPEVLGEAPEWTRSAAPPHPLVSGGTDDPP